MTQADLGPFALDLVTAFATPAEVDAFDVAATAMRRLGLDWLNFMVAVEEPYEMVRFRSTMPDSAQLAFAAVLSETKGAGDFLFDHCKTSTEPFWDRVDAFRPGSREQRRVLELAAQSGIRVLFAMPLAMQGLLGVVSAFGFGAAADALFAEPAERRRVEFVARLLAAHYDALGDEGSLAHPRRVHGRRALSGREAEALRLLAEGSQLARIAEAMGVSEPMAKRHISNARDKLGARTREQAVALAIRHQLI